MHLNNGLDIPPRNRDILETSILEILRTYNASMWLAGPGDGERNYVDSMGAQPLTGVNQLVGYVDDQLGMNEAENFVVNSEMVGASSGVVPTGWYNGSSANIVVSCVGAGTDEFGEYVDIRYAGTTLGAIEYPSVGMHPAATAVAALEGDLVSTQAYLQIMTTQGVGWSCYPATVFRNAAGSYVMDAGSGGQIGSDVRTLARTAVVGVGATIARVSSNISLACPAATVVNVVVRIWRPQQKKGGYPVSYIPTYGTAVIRTENLIHASQATTGFKPILAGGMRNELINSRTFSTWSQTGPGTVTLNAAKALDGSMTATLIERTGTAALFFSRSGTRPGTAAISFSGAVVAKPGINGRFITVRLQGVYPAYSDVMFDMHSGTVVYTKISGGMTLTKYSMSALKDGYWLCRMVTVDPGGASAVLSITTKETRTELDNTASAGDFSDVIIDNTALGFSSDFFEYPFPVNAAVVQGTNQVPYAWKFDGVDDRLVVSKPTINADIDHFKLIAYKAPAVAPVTNQHMTTDCLVAGVNNTACRIFLSSSYNIQAMWRDPTTAQNIPFVIRSTPNERSVVTARRVGANYSIGARSEFTAASSNTTAVALASIPLDIERIGCHSPAGTDGSFGAMEIYGVISGNGNPTAGEILALENFLAGHAGFTPLP